MNRTDRLLAIVLELQGRGARRAEDLAATFETSVRTIYRDMQALSETGVPVVATPGVGYALMEGYFLPPLTFTADEATTLLLGADAVARTFDSQYRAVAESASHKITAVLPDALRGVVRERGDRLRFVVPDALTPVVEETLRTLRRAVLESTGVRFHYYGRRGDREGGAATERDVDPYALVSLAGMWGLVGYDHLRRDIRRFRLDRMENLTLTDRPFTRPPDFIIENREDRSRDLVVQVRFAPAVARRVRESPSFFTVAQAERSDGLFVTLRVREAADPVPWLLGWGRYAHVLEPESVRALLAEEAAAILAQHTNPAETSLTS